MSTLKRNIIANYASQLYVTGVGIVILPLYVNYMGAEAYGLVGFFAMLQAWFTLLDLGLTPTISRETARYKGGSMSALEFRRLFRALSMIFAGIAIIGAGGLLLSSKWIASNWLTVELLSLEEVTFAVQVMALSVALRWLCGLYRGVVTGSEKLVWLSVFNVFVATMRFIAVFFSMWLYGFTPKVFFIHQMIVAFIELSGVWCMAQRLIPSINSQREFIGWSFEPVAPFLKFSLMIAFTSSMWVLITQTDKLILSGILSLTEYGYFTLAVLVASGIMVISGPISNAIMPRMSRLHAEGKQEELASVYRNATQLVSVIAGSAAITIALCAESLLLIWSGDEQLAKKVAPILRLYAIGNGMLALSAFPYYLQYAIGNLRYHFVGNFILALVLLPAISIAASLHGAIGAGWVWLSVNIFYLLFWASFVHYKLLRGLTVRWILSDVLCIVIPALILSSAYILFSLVMEQKNNTIFSNFLFIVLTAVFSFIGSLSFNRKFRDWGGKVFKVVNR